MESTSEHSFEGVISGSEKGPRAAVTRLGLAAAEPFYATAVIARNLLYDKGVIKNVQLVRPVISVGNLTTGGTGKTPMVRWMAGWLRDEGHRVAVIARGYKAATGQMGDEQVMLDRQLNGPGQSMVVVRSNPDRIAAAQAIVAKFPGIDVILLDDGFQHRKIARRLDIVLLSALDPFGYGHLLPRGLMREPVGALKRAQAIVITHADRVKNTVLADIERRIRAKQPKAPIYKAVHLQTGLRTPLVAASAPPDRTMNDLRAHQYFAFCGIGNPQILHRHLKAIGGNYVGHRWLEDHHVYTGRELAEVQAEATKRGADLLITTEKDWVKVGQLPHATIGHPPIWRLDVEMKFVDGDGEKLSAQIRQALSK